MMGILKVIAVFSFFAGICSCGGSTTSTTVDRVSTFAQARQEYLSGLAALREADYPKAMDYLQKVARGPSYLEYPFLARLRLADALFFQEKYEEAIDQYRNFVETSQGHPNLHYAYFKLAESTVRSIPAEFILLPPTDRRDQRKVRASMTALQDFVNRFPDSPYVVEALAMLDRMTAIVTSYETEVANFYLSRDKPRGAVKRLRKLMDDVPRAAFVERIRVMLASALLAANDSEGLRKECEAYVERFPGGVSVARMKRVCARAYQSGGAH